MPVLIGAAVIDRNPLRWTSFVVDLTSRQRAEQERAELVASTRAARGEADNARERLAFLMRAGALVAATRDRDELLGQIVKLVVPTLADCCVVFLPTADGTLLASALGHTDPAQADQLAELRAHPIAPAGPLLSQRAYASGATQLSRDATAEMPAWARAEPDAMDIVKLMRPRSAISTPLLAGQAPARRHRAVPRGRASAVHRDGRLGGRGTRPPAGGGAGQHRHLRPRACHR